MLACSVDCQLMRMTSLSFWAPVNGTPNAWHRRDQSPRVSLRAYSSPVSWGYESRLASVRIISPPLAAPKATRLEVRVPGADVSPLQAG